ncbi:hypothetical protein GCM10009122_52970 [Fulvivirga kasyanovii]|uniref:Uncharacterized protein n=1 Tax=Fulvivirga kasyanovii TaxID=396812 RepID=A0ABW9RR34_9BACT|nr:hypothetical protein [Fulvivirga kasyanovii]MTI26639.1 hypothetical protein [Fulvivirga kasyanovii]
MDTQQQNSEQAKEAGKKDVQALYLITEYWQSDLQFFKDELQFLRSLLDKYFAHFIERENIDKTKQLADKLIHIEKDRGALEQRVSEHLKLLAGEVKGTSDGKSYEGSHARLETDTIDFLKRFREVKKEVFSHTEHIMESEKAKHLLK